MINIKDVEHKTIDFFIEKYPFAENFYSEHNIKIENRRDFSLSNLLNTMDEEELENFAIDKDAMLQTFTDYINQMIEFLGIKDNDGVETITILPGTNKSGDREKFESLVFKKSEIVCIVGPTGSGKSRLLADIEWVAQNDTPTNRTILINDELADKKWRFSANNKLVAQLSQNMNFVMDLSVYEFIELHAKSRMVEDTENIIERIIDKANELAGEKFAPDTPITSLSGGQSRALMIADTAILSKSPIILIDEIENAGIDRKKALSLLVGEEKIVLMATHDPILALMGDRRVVIKNGGIDKIIETSTQEKKILKEIEALDKKLHSMREKLRHGEELLSF